MDGQSLLDQRKASLVIPYIISLAAHLHTSRGLHVVLKPLFSSEETNSLGGAKRGRGACKELSTIFFSPFSPSREAGVYYRDLPYVWLDAEGEELSTLVASSRAAPPLLRVLDFLGSFFRLTAREIASDASHAPHYCPEKKEKKKKSV